MNDLARAVRRAKYTPPVTFIEIDDDRTYRTFECSDDHIHARLTVPGCPETDLMFKTPEDAYEFAHALLRAYDKATDPGPPLIHPHRYR